METVLVINGETYWPEFLPDYKVERKTIQATEWLLKDSELFAVDVNSSICKPDKILWRVGAIRPATKHESALEMIRLSGIPCVNSAEVLLRGFDRLSMLNGLRACNLPVIPFDVSTTSAHLQRLERPFPFVVKAGNYHGGFGKVLIDSEEKWQDVRDLLFISEDYVTIEPFIKYERDLRYLAIGDYVWAMVRKGRFWKANVHTTQFALIDPDEELVEQTKRLKNYLNADILGIDILETADGQRFFVEYNDIPGLSGFPERAKAELAHCLKMRCS